MADEADGAQAPAVQDDAPVPLSGDNLRQMKIAMATLAGCVAETLNETDSSFQERFVARLDQAYENYRNNSDADPLHVLEVIHWTRELLNGWNPVPRQQSGIFGD